MSDKLKKYSDWLNENMGAENPTPPVNDDLEDIRYFRGSVAQINDWLNKKLEGQGKTWNPYADMNYKYPVERNEKDTSIGYQDYKHGKDTHPENALSTRRRGSKVDPARFPNSLDESVIGITTDKSFKPADLQKALDKAKIKYKMNRLSMTLTALNLDKKYFNDAKKVVDDLGLSVMMAKESLNEAKEYDLGLTNAREYEMTLGKAISKLDGINAYNDMANDYGRSAVNSMSGRIQISQYGKTDNTDALKKILKKADSNLDVNKIKNNFNATDRERSGHDQEKDIWKYDIPKKVDYHKAKSAGMIAQPPVTDMSPEVVADLMDMMAGYTSDANPLADVQWNSLDSFMKAASDYIKGSNFKKFQKSVEKKYPLLESTAVRYKKGDKVEYQLTHKGGVGKYKDAMSKSKYIETGVIKKRTKSLSGFKYELTSGLELYGSEILGLAENENINNMKDSNKLNEISTKAGLQDVAKGRTSAIEGIKMSKEMAEALMYWINTSPYGRKYGKFILKGRIASLIGPADAMGFGDRVSKKLKGEWKDIVQKHGPKRESVEESTINEAEKGSEEKENREKLKGYAEKINKAGDAADKARSAAKKAEEKKDGEAEAVAKLQLQKANAQAAIAKVDARLFKHKLSKEKKKDESVKESTGPFMMFEEFVNEASIEKSLDKVDYDNPTLDGIKITGVLAWDIQQWMKQQPDAKKLNKGKFRDLVPILHSRGFADRLNGANLKNWQAVVKKHIKESNLNEGDAGLPTSLKPDKAKSKAAGHPVYISLDKADKKDPNLFKYNGKLVDYYSIELDGIDRRDHPDYSDAFVSHAEYWKNGKALTDEEMEDMQDSGAFDINQFIHDNQLGY